jgi:sulfide dehydrogenase [flavocytochrome c] flavoprotein subunit
MSKITRRDFVKASGALGAAAAMGITAGCNATSGGTKSASVAKGHVVVIGGGYGGAICAKYLRLADKGIRVTLIERDTTYYSCPFSNRVIAQLDSLDRLAFNYDGMKAHGVNVIHDTVTEVNASAHSVKTASGQTISYDKLVVSPGVELKYKSVAGYSKAVSDKAPHAWKAGPQTQLLADQVKAMKPGENFIIVAPPNPFRCPPGPYERASLVGHFLKRHKPGSKVIILDPKDKFSKQGLFQHGWKVNNLPIEWVSAAQGGKVSSINVDAKEIEGEMETYKYGAASIIPPMHAGHIAHVAGLTNDKGWCPVDLGTFESTIHKDIYVIGDSSMATGMPKSGYAANTQAKVAAAVIADALGGPSAGEPRYTNTCYSFITPQYGISVAAVYRLQEDRKKIKSVGGGLTPIEGADNFMESIYAESWYQNITSDMFS